MSSNTNSMPRTSSASALSARGEVLEHVALGGAVGVVEDAGERLGPAAGGVLALDRRAELVADHLLDLLDDPRAGVAHARDPQGDVRLLDSGSRASTPAARFVCRLASTSATV